MVPPPAPPPATPPAKLAAGSSPLKEEAGGEAEQEAGPHRQPSLDPLCGLESVPLLYSSSGPRLSPPTLFRPLVSSLPTVRIIPDPLEAASPAVEEGVAAGEAVLGPAPLTSGQLYPGHQSPLLQAEVTPYDHGPYHEKKPLHLIPRMSEAAEAAQLSPGHGPHPAYPPGYPPRHHLDPRDSPGPGAGAGYRTTSPGAGPGAGFGRTNIPHHRHYGDTRQVDPPKPAQQGQFGHCPKARDGPALSCNFCWNTTDGSGRILRRKTKYHCPECQTNLCIVPCFQQYHEAMENENTEMR